MAGCQSKSLGEILSGIHVRIVGKRVLTITKSDFIIHFMIYSMRDKASLVLASLRPGRIRVRRLLILCALLAGLMAIGLYVATSSELAAISDGNIVNVWGLSLFLLVGAATLGLCAGIAEVTRYRDLFLTLPKLPWAALIKRLLSRVVRTILALQSFFSAALLTISFCVIRSFRMFYTLPPLTPDLWPSGPAPRILYEAS